MGNTEVSKVQNIVLDDISNKDIGLAWHHSGWSYVSEQPWDEQVVSSEGSEFRLGQ